MSGQTILHLIADYYNPLLLLIAIITLVFTFAQQGAKEGTIRTIQLIIGIIIIYSILWLDNLFWIWPSVNLDFSTHFAFALVMVLFLMLTPVKGKSLLIASLVCYVAILLYKKFHTTGDIFSTAVVVLPLAYTAMTAIKNK